MTSQNERHGCLMSKLFNCLLTQTITQQFQTLLVKKIVVCVKTNGKIGNMTILAILELIKT